MRKLFLPYIFHFTPYTEFMGEEGFEPSSPFGQRVLSPSCLPGFTTRPKSRLTVLFVFITWTRGVKENVISGDHYKSEARIGIEPMYKGFVLRSFDFAQDRIPSGVEGFDPSTSLRIESRAESRDSTRPPQKPGGDRNRTDV